MLKHFIFVVVMFLSFPSTTLFADPSADTNQNDDAQKTLLEANLAIDKISNVPPATTMPSSTVPDMDLLNATRAYEADRRAADDKLKAAFDTAIASAQNRSDAGTVAALKLQRDLILRDGVMPKMEDGWTILFRSVNPFLFNTPVSNAKSYSLPMCMAPAGMKFLRFRRMDTGDYVIVPLSNDQILANGPLTASYWWRGDKVIDHQSCELGITDQRVPSDSNGIMAMEPDGNRTGWGFARTIAGERQSWVWAGVELDPTVFEIAVTTRDLTPEEQTHVLQ